jgi:tetratricopeptide (TPR) repeat protein
MRDTMRTFSVFVLGIVLTTLSLFLSSQEDGTRAQIHGKSGENWILNKGTDDGVKVGMKGYFWTKQQSGGKEYNLPIATFRVEKVEKKQCLVARGEIDAGFSAEDFQWASFEEKLIPPQKTIPEKPPQKSDTRKSPEIPPYKLIDGHIDKGEEHLNAGNHKDAKVYFWEAKKLSVKESGKNYRLKEIEAKLSKIRGIEDRIEKEQKIRDLVIQAEEMLLGKKLDEAVKCCKEVLKLDQSTFSKEENKQILSLLLSSVKEKYLNTNDKMGLDFLLELPFAKSDPEYEKLKQAFEANIKYTQYLKQGDEKCKNGQFKDAERLYNLAAEIKPSDAEVKKRKEQCRKMKNAEKNRTEIDNRLKTISRKDLSDSETTKIAAEVSRLIDATDNLEALIKIFDKYGDKPVHLKELKFEFYKKLVEKFKNVDQNKCFKYFEEYMNLGWVNPGDIEEYLRRKIKVANGILTFDEARTHLGEKISRYYKNEKGMWEIELENGMKFVFIPAGNYRLKLKYVFVDSFFMGKYELTNRCYETFCRENKKEFKVKKEKSNHPVVNVNWNDAKMYCQWFSKRTGLNIDLPTEAQWVKAALSGSSSIYFWGEKINSDYLWYWGNSKKLHEVGKKKSNHWGIYDILGNAQEWIKDWFVEKKVGGGREYFANPIGPEKGTQKVLKGGGWYSRKNEVTIPHRRAKGPKSKDKTFGFRVVINLRNN